MPIPWPTTGAAIAESLKWPESRATDLEDYAAVAVSKIEEKVGPWHGQPLTHVVTTRREVGMLALPWPVASVQSITRGDEQLETGTVNAAAGILYGTFPAGTYTITAVARPAESCPPEIKLAARRLGAHLAKQELVGPRQPGFAGGPDKDLDVQQGFALPRAVSELIADYVRPGAFA